MRIFLLFHGRFPSEKAASLFAAESCAAFAEEECRVTLLVPRRLGRAAGDPHAYYGLAKTFKIQYLPTLDLFGVLVIGEIAHRVSLVIFSLTALGYLLLFAKGDDVVYSNESLPLLVSTPFFKNTLYEMHDYPEQSRTLYALLFRRVRHILITNSLKYERFRREFPFAVSKAFVEPNAVDVEKFSLSISRDEARAKLSIPRDKKIALYTGHLYAWKGVDTYAEVAGLLPDVLFYIVGGTDEGIRLFKEKYAQYKNLILTGCKPHADIPLWQKAADVLVLPNTAKEEISAQYTSPMKLFEYIASGKPIVASDLPSIREIANEERAVLVTPDDSRALADGISHALKSGDKKTSEAALAWVQNHTWLKRARRILAVVKRAHDRITV